MVKNCNLTCRKKFWSRTEKREKLLKLMAKLQWRYKPWCVLLTNNSGRDLMQLDTEKLELAGFTKPKMQQIILQLVDQHKQGMLSAFHFTDPVQK